MCHERSWETTSLGCGHLDKTKTEKLVNRKNTGAKMDTDRVWRENHVHDVEEHEQEWAEGRREVPRREKDENEEGRVDHRNAERSDGSKDTVRRLPTEQRRCAEDVLSIRGVPSNPVPRVEGDTSLLTLADQDGRMYITRSHVRQVSAQRIRARPGPHAALHGPANWLHRAWFVATERVTCTTPTCGGPRRAGARVCNRRCQATPDIIMWLLGAFTSGVDEGRAEEPGSHSTPDLLVGLLFVHLPRDFTARIRSLPANTVLHVSTSCCLRMIAAVAHCWEGMARGSDEHSQLEEGWSELLVSQVLPRLGAAVEVSKRVTLWEERRFEDLLRRAEEHLVLSYRTGKKTQRTSLDDTPALADRARWTSAIGTYHWARLFHDLFRGE